MKELKDQQEFLGLMKELIVIFKPKVYVELGTEFGSTFNRIAPLVELAIAVDHKITSEIIDAGNILKFEMETEEFIAKFSTLFNLVIDFLFIDADHKKESVLADFDGMLPFVREGTGLIFLHDTHPANIKRTSEMYCNNAWEAAWEIRTNKKYQDAEIITLPGPIAGISIIRKSKNQLSWRANEFNNCSAC